MANSINTNISAYYAQQNIGIASQSASLSVARLSSGNRIINAKDDVAGLAVGTSLATAVATLRAALGNTASGNSLLQVADGALGQISDILERQKALAAQAGSGSLSDANRALLDKEFQSLNSEIDRLATSTEFSGVNLLDGSVSGSDKFFTNDNDSDAGNLGTGTIVTISASLPSTNDTLTVAGVEFTFVSGSQPGAVAAAGKITVGNSEANTALNIAAALNKAASTDGRLANLFFVASAATVIARWTGGDGVGTVAIDVSASFTSTANTVADISIDISAGTNGLGINRTSFVGALVGSLFADGGSATHQSGLALSLAAVEDNADFVGKIGTGKIGLFTGNYTTTDTATFSLVVGDITYSTTATDITNAAGTGTTLTFIGSDEFGAAKGGQFTLKIDGSLISTFDSQAELNPIIQQLNDGFAGVSFVQNRDILNVANTGEVLLGATQVADTTGFQYDLRTDDFSKLEISSFKITAPAAGGTDAVFEVTINGELYKSVSGIGNQIGKNEVIALQNVNDSSKLFTITTGNTGLLDATATTLDLSSQDKADVIGASIATSLGIGTNSKGLQFQVGATADQQLDVKIGAADTATLFGGETLSIATQAGAAAAASVLDDAVDLLGGIRADVGSLQSRFAFAAANLQISIQNQDAARSELLDTDIAAESTSYATAQVKLQAGISVLAQANQQLQSLLKLIG